MKTIKLSFIIAIIIVAFTSCKDNSNDVTVDTVLMLDSLVRQLPLDTTEEYRVFYSKWEKKFTVYNSYSSYAVVEGNIVDDKPVITNFRYKFKVK